MFVDVQLNLGKHWKDWPMGNKQVIADNYSYKLLSWMIMSKVLTQVIEKVPRHLKVQISRTKKLPNGQFWVAMRKKDLANSRLNNQSFPLNQQPHTEIILDNALWIFTAIICIRCFLSNVFPQSLYLQRTFPWCSFCHCICSFVSCMRLRKLSSNELLLIFDRLTEMTWILSVMFWTYKYTCRSKILPANKLWEGKKGVR